MNTDLSLRSCLFCQLPSTVSPCISIISQYCDGNLFYYLQDERHPRDQRTESIEPNSIYLRITQYLSNSELLRVSSRVSKSCGFYKIRNDENMWKARAIVQLTTATADFVFKTQGGWKKVCLSLITVGIDFSPGSTDWSSDVINKKGDFKAGLLDGHGKKTRNQVDENGQLSTIWTETGSFERDELHGPGERIESRGVEKGLFAQGKLVLGSFERDELHGLGERIESRVVEMGLFAQGKLVQGSTTNPV